jgi:hypothetical protein
MPFPMPALVDPTGFSSFQGGMNYAFLQEGVLLPILGEVWPGLAEELKRFGRAFRPIAYEALFDVPLFLAGTGAAAIPAWIVPGWWKIPAVLPGLGLSTYSIVRFVRVVAAQRERMDYLDAKETKLRQALSSQVVGEGGRWESKLNELAYLRDQVGDEAAAAQLYEQEKAVADVADRYVDLITEKEYMTLAEFEDLFRAWIAAPTPESQLTVQVQMQAAAANIIQRSNECLRQEGLRAQATCFRTLMERDVRGSTALDLLRAIGRGDYSPVPGFDAFAADAAKAFQGV